MKDTIWIPIYTARVETLAVPIDVVPEIWRDEDCREYAGQHAGKLLEQKATEEGWDLFGDQTCDVDKTKILTDDGERWVEYIPGDETRPVSSGRQVMLLRVLYTRKARKVEKR